jgi:hypothetical protein
LGDNEKVYTDEFFNDKKYEDLYFDNFFDMDQMFGHENSLFGTRGLPVGHPKRTSKSFNQYNERFGPMVVRVVKDTNLQEQISRIQSMMGVINESHLSTHIKRRVTIEELDDLVDDVKGLIDSGYDRTDAIYDTVRQFIASNEEFIFPNSPEQEYWNSYIMVEKPLVDYIKEKL